MPLPKIATPTYELVLPSSGRKIKYRPFLVKEEKILIIALESQDHKTDIKLDDTYTLRMRYPSLNEFIKTNFTATDMKVDDTFELIASCIDQVYSEEESWTQNDCTKKLLTEFLEQLNSSQFKEIEQFFDTMPKLSHKVKVINPNTNVESEIVLEGLQNFFG